MWDWQASAADKRAGLVRNGGTSVSNYHTARKYAQSSVKVKLAEALQKVYTLEGKRRSFVNDCSLVSNVCDYNTLQGE